MPTCHCHRCHQAQAKLKAINICMAQESSPSCELSSCLTLSCSNSERYQSRTYHMASPCQAKHWRQRLAEPGELQYKPNPASRPSPPQGWVAVVQACAALGTDPQVQELRTAAARFGLRH